MNEELGVRGNIITQFTYVLIMTSLDSFEFVLMVFGVHDVRKPNPIEPICVLGKREALEGVVTPGEEEKINPQTHFEMYSTSGLS